MCRLRKMVMLLSVHMTSVLFLVRFNNSPWLWASIGVTRFYSSHPFLCALGWEWHLVYSCSRIQDYIETERLYWNWKIILKLSIYASSWSPQDCSAVKSQSQLPNYCWCYPSACICLLHHLSFSLLSSFWSYLHGKLIDSVMVDLWTAILSNPMISLWHHTCWNHTLEITLAQRRYDMVTSP